MGILTATGWQSPGTYPHYIHGGIHVMDRQRPNGRRKPPGALHKVKATNNLASTPFVDSVFTSFITFVF